MNHTLTVTLIVGLLVIVGLFCLVHLENLTRKRQYEEELRQLREAIKRAQA